MYRSLQTGRALAALLVVFYHLEATITLEKYFGPVIPSIFAFGHAGVNFFFVLSGFIIFFVHWRDLGCPHRLKNYAKKRFVRIYPIYWLVFLVVYLSALLLPSLRNTVPHDVLTVVKSLLLVPQDAAHVGGTGAPVLIVAWSLQYEILFYLCFAVGIFSRFAGLALALGAVAFYLIPLDVSFPFSFLKKEWILLFLMGGGTAFAVMKTKGIFPLLMLFVGVLIFGLNAVREVVYPEGFWWGMHLFYGVGSCFIIYGLIKLEDNGIAIGTSKFVQLLGAASYVLYLIHYPVISLLAKVAIFVHLQGRVGAILAYGTIAGICVIAALLVHLFVEIPIVRWLSPQSKLAKSRYGS